jgi:hypothetical protein
MPTMVRCIVTLLSRARRATFSAHLALPQRSLSHTGSYRTHLAPGFGGLRAIHSSVLLALSAPPLRTDSHTG